MRKFNQFLVAGMTLSSLFFVSCNNDDDSVDPQPSGDYINGVIVLNEGNFGASNASASFIGANGILENNIYQAVNGISMGDVAQSIYTEDDKAYIVLNGSATVEVVNRYTFEHLGTVSNGLVNPRYVIVENGKGYVSNWGDPTDTTDDFIAVVNLSNYTVESTIPVAEGPEKMVEENGKIYVAHMGGWGYGNTISVINTANNSVSGSINVGDVPHSMEEENGKLYVICKGKEAWTGEETLGGLYVIDLSNNAVLNNFSFAVGQHPSHLEEENGKLYFTLGDQIFSTNTVNPSIPSTPIFTTTAEGVFGAYGFAVNDGKIYVADAGDYVSNGKVYVYSTSGSMLNSFTVGFLPNGFAFND